MLALEMLGCLDGERLAVAMRARRTVNLNLKPRARQLHRRCLQSSSASRFTAGAAGFFILSQSGERPER
jgi:hypothetical protein